LCYLDNLVSVFGFFCSKKDFDYLIHVGVT
jgi:hypothetical protein